MGCGGSKSSTNTPPKTENQLGAEENIPTQGCYLTYDDNELFCKWSNAEPEGTTIVFAKAGRPVPPGRLSAPARLITAVENELSFFKGLRDFIYEVAPLQCQLFISADADSNSYVPFLLAVHQPGNNVIGDRTLKGKPGDKIPLYLDGIDGAAVVPGDSTEYDQRSQTIEEFIDVCDKAGGAYARLDASGKKPPL